MRNANFAKLKRFRAYRHHMIFHFADMGLEKMVWLLMKEGYMQSTLLDKKNHISLLLDYKNISIHNMILARATLILKENHLVIKVIGLLDSLKINKLDAWNK